MTMQESQDPALAPLVALQAASQHLAQARIGEKDILERLHSEMRKLLPPGRVHILLFRENQTKFFAWNEEGEAFPPSYYQAPAAQSIVGWMRDSRESLLVRDFQRDWDKLPAKPSHAHISPPRSAIFAPLVVADEALGAVSVQSDEPDLFAPDHLWQLRILANQTAAALHAGRLLRAERWRANQLSTLAEVTRSVVSILDLDELLTHVVDLIQEAFGYHHVQIFVIEKGARRAMFRASSGLETNELWRRVGRSTRLGEGIIGWVLEHGETYLAPDVSRDPLYIPDDPRHLTDIRSEIALPLKLEDSVLGVLDVQSNELNAFDSENQFILNALADTVASAVANARLYKQVQEDARTATELEVARNIQIGFLPDHAPQPPGYEVAATWEPARQIGGDFYDFIPLADGRLGIVVADVADKGIPAALYMALSRTTMRLVSTRDPAPSIALQRVNTAILDTTYSDLFVTIYYAILDPASHQVTYASGGHGLALQASEAGITFLRGKGTVLGVLPTIAVEEHTTELAPGDYLIIYTDGVTDAVNEAMEDFGEKRLVATIRRHWGLAAQAMLERIHQGVRAWSGSAPPFDDFTLVVVRRMG